MSMERQESLSLISSLRERSMKNKNKIYFFLVFLFMLLVLSNILGYMIGEIFYYCIKPFMYLLSAIILCYLIPNRKLIWLDHKLIDLFLVVGIIIVEILLFGAGIFFGFAHNPLQLTLEKLILNFFYLIVIVLAQEFMRIRLLRAIPQKNNKWYGALLVVKENKLGIKSDKFVEIIDLRFQKENIHKIIDNNRFYPGYHMNKNNWITIKLDNSVETKKIFELIDNSYNLSLKNDGNIEIPLSSNLFYRTRVLSN